MTTAKSIRKKSAFHVTFLGANSTVTGSKYLVEAGGKRLLVDCGLFQGYKPLRLRNWAEFPVDPASIDAVVLTHAHLDHSGYLPRLITQGFQGKIWATAATKALCGILLPDSGRLLQEDANHANKAGSTKHHPAEPLYDEAQARKALRMFKSAAWERSFEPVPGLRVRLRPQGHILGAAAVTVESSSTRITFSGDIGRNHDPVMPPPSPPAASDWIVVESTYGNRVHASDNLEQELLPACRRVLARGGTIVLPAFAVGRAQLLLLLIARLQHRGELPRAPLYLNSPMAADVTELYERYAGEHVLGREDFALLRKYVKTVGPAEESKALNARHGPQIVVSASGMLTGGRVLHHIRAFGPDPRNAIVLAGFQAGGTRGAALAAGARSLRIYGEQVDVNAEVICLQAASAHADANELMAWLRSAPTPPRGVFVTHGEPDASDALRLRIEHELGWPAHIPEYRDRVDLLSGYAVRPESS
jgi:metallo-beta-lactamase family protein